MNPMLKVSAAVLFAAISALPALAATAPVASATITMGTKAELAKATALDKIIGKWTLTDVHALGKAAKVTVFDTKALYAPADAKLVAAADTKMMPSLTKLHTAIDADAGVKAWFANAKIDVSRVIAITDTKGKVDVFLY